MTTACRRAVRSMRVIAHLNIRQARAAKRAGNLRMAAHHTAVALESRRDANTLKATAL